MLGINAATSWLTSGLDWPAAQHRCRPACSSWEMSAEMGELGEKRKEMDAALKRDVVPILRAKGFKGTYPYFRRHGNDAIDLLSFQFDKYGGGFFIELARSPPEGFVTPFGQAIPPNKVKSWFVWWQRDRITHTLGGVKDDWFRFDEHPIETIVALVIEGLRPDDLWRNLGPPFITWRGTTVVTKPPQ